VSMRGPASANRVYGGRNIAECRGSEAAMLHGYDESAGVAATGTRYYS
jgi:hypothetical protein